jgi:hypothetical protein
MVFFSSSGVPLPEQNTKSLGWLWLDADFMSYRAAMTPGERGTLRRRVLAFDAASLDACQRSGGCGPTEPLWPDRAGHPALQPWVLGFRGRSLRLVVGGCSRVDGIKALFDPTRRVARFHSGLNALDGLTGGLCSGILTLSGGEPRTHLINPAGQIQGGGPGPSVYGSCWVRHKQHSAC